MLQTQSLFSDISQAFKILVAYSQSLINTCCINEQGKRKQLTVLQVKCWEFTVLLWLKLEDWIKQRLRSTFMKQMNNGYCVVFNNIICSYSLDLESGTGVCPRLNEQENHKLSVFG